LHVGTVRRCLGEARFRRWIRGVERPAILPSKT